VLNDVYKMLNHASNNMLNHDCTMIMHENSVLKHASKILIHFSKMIKLVRYMLMYASKFMITMC